MKKARNSGLSCLGVPDLQRTGEVVTPFEEGAGVDEPAGGNGSIGGSGTREVDDDEGADGVAEVTGAGPVPPRCAAA